MQFIQKLDEILFKFGNPLENNALNLTSKENHAYKRDFLL